MLERSNGSVLAFFKSGREAPVTSVPSLTPSSLVTAVTALATAASALLYASATRRIFLIFPASSVDSTSGTSFGLASRASLHSLSTTAWCGGSVPATRASDKEDKGKEEEVEEEEEDVSVMDDEVFSSDDAEDDCSRCCRSCSST